MKSVLHPCLPQSEFPLALSHLVTEIVEIVPGVYYVCDIGPDSHCYQPLWDHTQWGFSSWPFAYQRGRMEKSLWIMWLENPWRLPFMQWINAMRAGTCFIDLPPGWETGSLLFSLPDTRRTCGVWARRCSGGKCGCAQCGAPQLAPPPLSDSQESRHGMPTKLTSKHPGL